MGGTRNTEEEKLRRLQEVQQLLRARLAGRGICREGIERIASQSGLTHAWLDDNILSIAGNNCVDLEIVFDEVQRDLVKDVILKINVSGVDEHKKEASAVLRRDLWQSDNGSGLPWKSLENFSANLDRLAHLDQLSTGINCFEALDGLYHSFQRIWKEEKRRLQSMHVLSRTCQGAMGRPVMHKTQKLGYNLDYWIEKRRLRERDSQSSCPDAVDFDPVEQGSDDDDKQSLPSWTAKLGCEAGYPPLRVAKDWIGEEIFLQDELEADDHTNNLAEERGMPKIAWLDPPPTLVASSDVKDDPEAMAMDGAGAGVSLPKPPNIRFTFNLEPTVLVPMNAISAMIAMGLTIPVDVRKALTYRQALDALGHRQKAPHEKEADEILNSTATAGRKRWDQSITVYDKNGESSQIQHSYSLRSSMPLWCYPIQSMSFEHPRQLAKVIPALRQYALLWSIVRKLVPVSAPVSEISSTPPRDDVTHQSLESSRRAQKKSNIGIQRAKLDVLLNGAARPSKATGLAITSAGNDKSPLSIDVSLSLTSTSPLRPKLDLIFPLPVGSQEPMGHPCFGTVCVEIGANGEVLVPSITGLPFTQSDQDLKKAASVLAISEDMSVLVQWLLSRTKER